MMIIKNINGMGILNDDILDVSTVGCVFVWHMGWNKVGKWKGWLIGNGTYHHKHNRH